MTQAADVVATVKYEGIRRMVDRTLNPRAPDYATAYSLGVQELLKSNANDPAVGDVLEIVLPGGEKELPTHIHKIVVEGAEELETAHLYVVFLRRDDQGRLYPPWGAHAILDITEGVKAITRVKRGREEYSVPELIDTIRAAPTPSRLKQ